jgi:predicted ABC-type transport system involved in lysophospholipase L1 biosynthesis ATPase subunit
VKKIKTQNVSLPIELHDWVVKKMEETKASTPWAKVTFSSVVEHALIELRKGEQGKVQSGAGVVIEPESETSASGHLTPRKTPSRKAG